MAQLFAQQDRQPDVWVMSGAPTATVVYLSLQTTINYSSGSPDTLPPNTPAVIYGTADTAFDRSLDVWVPFTVRASGVLSIIKESALATITADYVAMARVELHGIKPYQPEPYLASGGLGTTGTSSGFGSGAGLERTDEVAAGGTPPSGWEAPGYDDSAWALSVADTNPGMPAAYAGSGYVARDTVGHPTGTLWLFRRALTLPSGAPTSATIQAQADNYIDGLWLNGTLITATYGVIDGTGLGTVSASVPLAVLSPGAVNTLAVQMRNASGLTATNWMRLDYLLSVSYVGTGGLPDPGGAEGALLYFHDGAWVSLPAGTSGYELTMGATDPAWTAQPADSDTSGTVTSVALAGPTGTTVSGSPVTSSGTISLSWASQTANTFLGAPSGSSGAPTFRLLVGADIPVDASTIVASAGTIKGNYQAGSGISISGNTISATGGGGSGTVTSVALTVPGFLSVSGSPITTSGTLAVTLANENANTVFAGPSSGSAAAPTFRALAAVDLPAAAAAGGHVHAHGHFI